MPNFDKNRIFNESPTKVLKREYENLKQDFSKLNAMKYKTFYENASLSFILENSNLIFTEPYKGLEFYKNIMENSILPFNVIEREIGKVDTYISEHTAQMSDTQREDYTSLLKVVENRYEKMKNSSCLYDTMMEKTEYSDDVYDDLYEYAKNPSEYEIPETVLELMEGENINLLDTINVILEFPELHPELVNYLNACYYESPKTPDEYRLNAYTTNVMSRIMKDSYFSERVSHIPNMNLRHLIMGLGGVKSSEIMDEIMTERVVNYDPMYAGAENSVNRVFEDDVYSELLEDVNTEEKVSRLLCEKAVIDMNLAFMSMDFLHDDTITKSVDPIVEQVCVESTTIEKIPQDISGQMKLLEEKAGSVDTELMNINEKYFTAGGGPSRVVSYSVGRYGQDTSMNKAEREKEPETTSYYTPKKRETETKSSSSSGDKSDDDDHHAEEDKKAKDQEDKENPNHEDNTDDVVDGEDSDKDKKDEEDKDDKKEDHEEEEDEDEDSKKRNAAKKRRDDKYANMDVDDSDLKSITESFFRKKEPEDKVKDSKNDDSQKDDSKNDDKNTNTDDAAEVARQGNHQEGQKVEKPEKRPLAQRVQNAALDANVKFKKTVAKGKRAAQDIRNAGRAIAKIPTNIVNSLKRTIEMWEEQDDNRRKEYIIQPGYRKKYFKAFQIAISHYIAWAINPLLNIVLAISHAAGAKKDERMKNELVRELKAEIKVTEEKIEDAKANGDQQQKYKLMRIKEKLDAELVRVGANAKYL